MSFRPDLKNLLRSLPPQAVGVSGLAILCATSALVLVPAGAPAAAIAAALGGMGFSVVGSLLQNAYQNLLSRPDQGRQERIVALASALEQELDARPALAVEMAAFLQTMGADEVAAELARESPAHSWLLLSLRSDIGGIRDKLQDIAGGLQYDRELDHTRHEQLGTALAAIVVRLDHLIAGAEAQPASPSFTIPYTRNPQFVGREDELTLLAGHLDAGKTAVLAGIGGVGKTQLAVELAHRAREAGSYPGGIFWLLMDPPEGIAAQAAALAGPEGMDLPGYEPAAFESNIAAVKRAWAGPEPRLLIFDNLENPALLDEWRPTAGGARVLATTRRAAWPARLGVEVVTLEPLARRASLELLLAPAPGPPAWTTCSPTLRRSNTLTTFATSWATCRSPSPWPQRTSKPTPTSRWRITWAACASPC